MHFADFWCCGSTLAEDSIKSVKRDASRVMRGTAALSSQPRHGLAHLITSIPLVLCKTC